MVSFVVVSLGAIQAYARISDVLEFTVANWFEQTRQ